MGCRNFGISMTLIGLHQIGIVGLKDALAAAAQSGLREQEAVLDLIITELSTDNFIPDHQREPYRRTIWREYLRHRGEDFSDFYSEVELIVRGDPGADRDAFVATLISVFAEFELKPLIIFAEPDADGPNPQLVIGDEPVVQGLPSRRNFKIAVRKRITDW